MINFQRTRKWINSFVSEIRFWKSTQVKVKLWVEMKNVRFTLLSKDGQTIPVYLDMCAIKQILSLLCALSFRVCISYFRCPKCDGVNVCILVELPWYHIRLIQVPREARVVYLSCLNITSHLFSYHCQEKCQLKAVWIHCYFLITCLILI